MFDPISLGITAGLTGLKWWAGARHERQMRRRRKRLERMEEAALRRKAAEVKRQIGERGVARGIYRGTIVPQKRAKVESALRHALERRRLERRMERAQRRYERRSGALQELAGLGYAGAAAAGLPGFKEFGGAMGLF